MTEYQTQYIILMPLVIQLLGLLLVVLNDKYINKEQRRTMAVIIGIVSLLVVQNVIENILSTIVFMAYLRTVVSIMGYILRPTVIVLFCNLVAPKKKNSIIWILNIINACIYLTALVSPAVFYIDDENHYQRGSLLSYTAFIVSAVLLAFLVYYTLSEFRYRKSSILISALNVALITIAAVLDLTPLYQDYPVSFLTIAVVSCVLFYYIWLHIEFVREHENALKAEQRIQIMMSQIQPHFLFNTLSTIQALCLTDPHKAAMVTERFGTYLRSNIDSLDRPNLIELKKELEHTRIYTEIEMLRFPKIEVRYDIQAENFFLPALSIQPLVENAIRHGVRSRKHGLVTVATREENGFYIIEISDNGIGFDPDNIIRTDGKHVGLANVKERIETMCGGTMTIDSRIDEGTTITIMLPRRTV